MSNANQTETLSKSSHILVASGFSLLVCWLRWGKCSGQDPQGHSSKGGLAAGGDIKQLVFCFVLF